MGNFDKEYTFKNETLNNMFTNVITFPVLKILIKKKSLMKFDAFFITVVFA